MQTIDKSIFEELERRAKLTKEGSVLISNKNSPKGSWTQKIVSKVKISDLASEFGVDKCPKCNYDLLLDDSSGLFICVRAKYSGKKDCDVGGNIVKFMEMFA